MQLTWLSQEFMRSFIKMEMPTGIYLNHQQLLSAHRKSHLAWHLESYSIHHGYIEYKDEEGNMQMEIVNLNHQGSGKFNSDEFVLSTKSSSDALVFVMALYPFLLIQGL